MDNWTPTYREWAKGELEQQLPESREDHLAENRLSRVERTALHIQSGADRTICRGMVYTEEEWRSAVFKAGGKEPGFGWFSQPARKDTHGRSA